MSDPRASSPASAPTCKHRHPFGCQCGYCITGGCTLLHPAPASPASAERCSHNRRQSTRRVPAPFDNDTCAVPSAHRIAELFVTTCDDCGKELGRAPATDGFAVSVL